MCLLQKKHFYRPLKMLYRYKSKWYMPPKLKDLYGVSKAKANIKEIKRARKRIQNKLLKNIPSEINHENGLTLSLKKGSLPVLLKQKQTSVFRKKYNRYKTLKKKLQLRKKKNILKKYFNKLLSKKTGDHNATSQKLIEMGNNLTLLNLYYQKNNLIRKLENIKRIVLNRHAQHEGLKKRFKNTFGSIINYYLTYTTMQKIILAVNTLIKRKKKIRKTIRIFNFLKAKQSLGAYSLKEKENYIYNDDILDSNFMEPELRENLGVNPAINLVNYFKKTISTKQPFNHAFIKKNKKIYFRVKKKNNYKKYKDRYYSKKRRIIFADRSYNRLGLNDVKHLRLKWKRNPFSLINTTVRKSGLGNKTKIEELLLIIKKAAKRIYKKRKKKGLVFVSPSNLINKLHTNYLINTKMALRMKIKREFKALIQLFKIELKKNRKKIRKFTRKIMYLKKHRGLIYRKIKIQVLNLRELIIRENQKLRQEIKAYRYTWKNSPFFNYDFSKTNKLKLMIETRKQKRNFLKIMGKYPEGAVALKARLQMSQYYTGLPLLKRRLE